jgi:hypothetical protein
MELIEKYKEYPFAYEMRESYMYQLIGQKKSVLYLPLRKKIMFYKKIKSFDRKILSTYMNLKDSFVYVNPLLMIFLSLLPVFILRPLRLLKRKIFNRK